MIVKGTPEEIAAFMAALQNPGCGTCELLRAYRNAPPEVQKIYGRGAEYLKETYSPGKDAAGAGDGGSQR